MAKYTKSNTVVNSSADKQVIRARLIELLKTNFNNTLGQVPDIVNLVMALIYKESSFNAGNIGIDYSRKNNTYKTYISSSAISAKYKSGSQAEKVNIENAAAAFGLMQVSGFYIIRGSSPTGKSELERLRPDICKPILVEPGVNVATKLTGMNNLDNQLLAGLIVLEGKYRFEAPKLMGPGRFNSRITAAMGAYLGTGTDGLGTTPDSYVASILGTSYRIANNGVGSDGKVLVASLGTASNTSTVSTGPIKTAASGHHLSTPGCG